MQPEAAPDFSRRTSYVLLSIPQAIALCAFSSIAMTDNLAKCAHNVKWSSKIILMLASYTGVRVKRGT